MTAALAGRTPATFEIKSANLPLVALLLKSSDLELLEQELQGRFGEVPEFFDNDPLVIDLAPVGDGALDFARLVALLKRYRVMPVAVKGGSEGQMQAALAAGLASASDLLLPRESAPTPALPQG